MMSAHEAYDGHFFQVGALFLSMLWVLGGLIQYNAFGSCEGRHVRRTLFLSFIAKWECSKNYTQRNMGMNSLATRQSQYIIFDNTSKPYK